MCDFQVPGDRQHQARGLGGQQAQAGHPGDRGQDRGIQAREPRGLQLGDQGQVRQICMLTCDKVGKEGHNQALTCELRTSYNFILPRKILSL